MVAQRGEAIASGAPHQGAASDERPENAHADSPPTAGVCCALQAWRILDFLVNYPESAHMLTWLLDEPGIPTDYRHMEGAPIYAP